MTSDLAYQVEIEVYQGPFDLLLKAIDDGQIGIYHVSISQIVNSYFIYWHEQQPNLVSASDFICMASYLVELKSKSLLPARDEIAVEEDNFSNLEDALVSHLAEYTAYKHAALHLKQRKETFERVYVRYEGEQKEKDIELVDVNLKDLVMAFQRIWQEAAKRETVVSIEAENITIEQRIEEIKQIIADKPEGVKFENIFIRKTRLEIVVTFLAILELAKQNIIQIGQDRKFGIIIIFEKGKDANGRNSFTEHEARKKASPAADAGAGLAVVQPA
ncbi:MAG: segregation/condensation protein A [Candidatus Margulisbacteria bacterium]|nr:segregation/condensation protein A [Candidatus Margulisiibacteriota bacterium]